MTIEIFDCTHEDYLQIANAITNFNMRHLPKKSSENMCSLALTVKQDGKKLLGGITGKLLLGNCLSIDVLWVEHQYRKQGLGRKLLLALEEQARLRTSKLSIVDTFDFQALGFYEKNGYTVFGTLEDCPCPGNKRYYLSKKL